MTNDVDAVSAHNQDMRWLRALTFLLLLLTALLLVVNQQGEIKRLLIVHSYFKNDAWDNDINDGISQALKQADPALAERLQIRYQYLNLKSNPNCYFYANAAKSARFSVDDWHPDAVLLVDDLAQALVGFNLIQLEDESQRSRLSQNLAAWLSAGRCESKAPAFFDLDNPYKGHAPEIIFAGINNSVERYGYLQASNVSGIFERKNLDALKDLLQMLAEASAQQQPRLMLLTDRSPTALSEATALKDYDWSPFTEVSQHHVGSYSEWRQTVVEANAQGALLLLTNYRNVRDHKGKLVDVQRLVSWTERHAEFPVLGANTSFIKDGGMLTAAVSGIEQGQVAMQMALKKLKGDSSREFVEGRQFTLGLNQSLVRKRGLKLPELYEAFAQQQGRFLAISEYIYMNQD